MELTEKEKMLIEAIRAMDEPPGNVLLWYSAGLEEAQRKSRTIPGNHYRVEQDQRRIDIANKYMREM
jgi:hypothetical protein